MHAASPVELNPGGAKQSRKRRKAEEKPKKSANQKQTAVYRKTAALTHLFKQKLSATAPPGAQVPAPINPQKPRIRNRARNQVDGVDFRGIPNPPSNAAKGCLEPDFCGAPEEAAASSTLRTEAGDGS